MHRQIAVGFNLQLALNRAEHTWATHEIPQIRLNCKNNVSVMGITEI